ncbi:hypothetical protein [Microbispora hainanensis]|uniref:Uncharacterized protein n=1 Tax=Microbispora hainanensis TaxID=568844 RepID=A0A544YQ55_9ACTN|nr:hypothetical protein [Microbispora hainanensis]TQS18889.1 hypothetical protein FLX08_22230 [Microbispora hainanensis]
MSRAKNKQRTATRLCATCGTPFTWTSRNPRRRFCDPVCKSRWWRASNTDTTVAHDTDAAADPAPSSTPQRETERGTDADTASSTANAVPRPYDPYVAGYGNGQAPSAVQNCPYCYQPVAIVNLLVTTTAAYVNTPSRSVTNTS